MLANGFSEHLDYNLAKGYKTHLSLYAWKEGWVFSWTVVSDQSQRFCTIVLTVQKASWLEFPHVSSAFSVGTQQVDGDLISALCQESFAAW